MRGASTVWRGDCANLYSETIQGGAFLPYHLFNRKIDSLGKAGKLTGQAKADYQYMLKHYGENLGGMEAQEKFATDMERYLRTGEAPNSKLKHIFETFKKWLTKVYNSVKDIKYIGEDGQEHSFELSPEMKEIFGRMLSGGELESSEELNSDAPNANNDKNLTFGDVEEFNPKEANAENARKAE